VTTLNIHANDIGPEGVEAYTAVLKETEITTLYFDKNDLDPKLIQI
jgi:hypothetical protein